MLSILLVKRARVFGDRQNGTILVALSGWYAIQTYKSDKLVICQQCLWKCVIASFPENSHESQPLKEKKPLRYCAKSESRKEKDKVHGEFLGLNWVSEGKLSLNISLLANKSKVTYGIDSRDEYGGKTWSLKIFLLVLNVIFSSFLGRTHTWHWPQRGFWRKFFKKFNPS